MQDQEAEKLLIRRVQLQLDGNKAAVAVRARMVMAEWPVVRKC